jgi:hypothetical protein
MASDGTVIGTLTSNLEESVTDYKLLKDDLPFVIDGNKLKVKQKIVPDYRDFGKNKDLFKYIEIEFLGSVSGKQTSGLYVHIISK